jgi:hypothetical protein
MQFPHPKVEPTEHTVLPRYTCALLLTLPVDPAKFSFPFLVKLCQ